MPRYIDADKLALKWMLASPKQRETFRQIIDDEPTADVAPRAEVAREIFEEIEKYNRPPFPEATPVYIMKNSEFVEIKKKYTGDGE